MIIGDPEALSRLVSFGRKLASWFTLAAAVFVLIVAPSWCMFLAQKGTVEGWLAPWLIACCSKAAFVGLTLSGTARRLQPDGCHSALSALAGHPGQCGSLDMFGHRCRALVGSALIGTQAAITMYYLSIVQRSFFCRSGTHLAVRESTGRSRFGRCNGGSPSKAW